MLFGIFISDIDDDSLNFWFYWSGKEKLKAMCREETKRSMTMKIDREMVLS